MSLRMEADEVVAKSNLLAVLKKFGSPVFTGSYKYDLMTTKDIDIYLVVEDPNKELTKKIVNVFIDQGFWNRIKYGDFLNFAYPKDQEFLDSSFYIGLKRGYGDEKWNVDIWIVTKDQASKLDYPWMKKISEQEREEILKMKSNKKSLGLTSFEIYKKVLKQIV